MHDWSPTDPDAVNVYYDLSAWTFDQRAELAAALAEAELPHGWEGDELVVPEQLELEVDALFEVLEAQLGIDPTQVPVVAPPDLTDGEPVTEYELDGWSVADRQMLSESLIAGRLPHRWEDTTLVVPTAAEEAVDELLDEIEEGEVVTLAASDADAEASARTIDDLFTAGNRLSRDPLDADGLTALLRALEVANPSAPPAGVMLGTWREVCAAADALADSLAAGDEPDELLAIDLAERLSEAIRPLV